MNRSVLVAVVVLLGVGGGVLYVNGSGPGGTLDSPDGDGTTGAETATATTTDDGAEGPATETVADGGDADRTGTATTGDSNYAFSILRVEKCGNTCRNVTARLSNTGATARENVRVTTEMYADDQLLWSGNESVGTLSVGESHTSTERVDVGFTGGLAISANDGYVTIVTVVESDGGTTRFSDRRKVA
ncbi:hypothetical protein [Halorussus caseinilyticus]|uniref:hypothetical protein n=1 Tax=Halorussus caseinilyticus TaxID=3034025 RepID=UPI0023E7B7F0|nr:hypothetical protein [Halorussus sp. DT72]